MPLGPVSGEGPIALVESDMSIDIVFIDIHLGAAANGPEVAEFLRRNRPNAPVIYTSGKSADPQLRAQERVHPQAVSMHRGFGRLSAANSWCLAVLHGLGFGIATRVTSGRTLFVIRLLRFDERET